MEGRPEGTFTGILLFKFLNASLSQGLFYWVTNQNEGLTLNLLGLIIEKSFPHNI